MPKKPDPFKIFASLLEKAGNNAYYVRISIELMSGKDLDEEQRLALTRIHLLVDLVGDMSWKARNLAAAEVLNSKHGTRDPIGLAVQKIMGYKDPKKEKKVVKRRSRKQD